MSKIYAIYNIEENTFLTFGSKVAWATIGAAKAAYYLHWGCKGKIIGTDHYFDDQTKYQIVELTEEFYRFKDLED